MKSARITISRELLKQVLCIPDNVDLIGIVHVSEFDQWNLVLAGDGLPDACHQNLSDHDPPQLTPTFYRDFPEQLTAGVVWKVK